MTAYTILVDDNQEALSLESAFEILGARINQEGWTTSYGGDGIKLFVECDRPKREVKMILSVCRTAKILQSKKM